MANKQTVKGNIKVFFTRERPAKSCGYGFGFIQQDGGPDVWFHASGATKLLETVGDENDLAGWNVEFEIEEGKGINVRVASKAEYGKGVETKLCRVCRAWTSHMKVVTFKTGTMISVKWTDDGAIITGGATDKSGGWCVPCRRREEEAEKAAAEEQQKQELAEAERFVGPIWIEKATFGDSGFQVVPGEILSVRVPKFGNDRSVQVRVKFEGRNPFLQTWPTWEDVRRSLCDAEGNSLFEGV